MFEWFTELPVWQIITISAALISAGYFILVVFMGTLFEFSVNPSKIDPDLFERIDKTLTKHAINSAWVCVACLILFQLFLEITK